MNTASGWGLVLRRVKHLDEDVRLTIFLRDQGKVLAISRGGQRLASKLKSVQEPFTEADFEVSMPEHGVHSRLIGGRLRDSHEQLRYSIPAFETAAKACETVDLLVPFRAPAPEVYDILRQSLQALNAHADPPQEWIQFVARLLKILGHGDVTAQLAALDVKKGTALIESELERVLPWKLKSKDLLS